MRGSARTGAAWHPAGVRFPAPVAVAELVSNFGGQADRGLESAWASGLAPIEDAEPGWLAPFTARRFLPIARRTGAALLVAEDLADLVPAGRRWIHPHAAYALARMLDMLRDVSPPPPGLVDPSTTLGTGVVVFEGASIGPNCVIEPNAVIYPRVRLGARVLVGAGAVLGRPGFGFVPSPEGIAYRVPQLGGVVIEDDAEIGPLATVDAGTHAPTVDGRWAKLDAHVHLGHNAVVGPGCFVAAQAGLAGSVRLGPGVRVGGQAGFADHVEVGEGAQIAAQSGVIGDVPAGSVFAGYPAVERWRWLRATARAMRTDRALRAPKRST
jgi:UDP-3-O-[3-hydroxymyristoyl] glucosamine N-acyltransferase